MAARQGKYGYWIGLAMLILAAGYLGLSYFGDTAMGIPVQELNWIIAAALGISIGVGAGYAHKTQGDIVALIISAVLVAGVGIAIYQGLLLELPIEISYALAVSYVYGLIAGRLL